MNGKTRKDQKNCFNKYFVLCLATISLLGLAVQPGFAQKAQDSIAFDLHANPKFAACLGVAGNAAPTAHVTVLRGALSDTLTIEGDNFRPKLAFDMFTVQHSNLLSTGKADPAFTGSFGMAWYQTDLQANAAGHFKTTIKTILLDQIFGFDADTSLPPTNAFHVGFWFNNPNDANTDGCTFDITKPTSFNGEHKAGPLAMISVPDNQSKLGPLCTDPNLSTKPATCNP